MSRILNFGRGIWEFVYFFTLGLFYPLNHFVLSKLRKNVMHENSVLHISQMIHVPYYTVKVLRKLGYKADYLAIGSSNVWNKSDFQKIGSVWPFILVVQEVFLFWRVVAKYEVVHLHFAIPMSFSGWELSVLKKMGRKIVINYRGCEIRNRSKNMSLHPKINICQDCDYSPYICETRTARKCRKLAEKYGDLFLVTTPDMKDFIPSAEHFPFFMAEVELDDFAQPAAVKKNKDEIKIVHVTNHPGIEGTLLIESVINRLKAKGYQINFVFLRNVTHDRVLAEYRTADLAIGKMKMGYYANAQIESMMMGVPTITWVRPEFMTAELSDSGFIFTTLDSLEETLEYYLTHPQELEKRRKIARHSIARLHNNDELGRKLLSLYKRLKSPS